MHESSSWVEIRLHAENQLPGYPGSGLKVTVVWWWWGGDRPITLLLKIELCLVELGCFKIFKQMFVVINDELAGF